MSAGQRPPVVQFALGVLEAPNRRALLDRCVQDLVERFDVCCAQVESAGGEVLARAGQRDEARGLVDWRYKLSRREDEPAVYLHISVAVTDDLFIIRQQFADLVAVVRSGLAHHRLIEVRQREAHEDELTGLENRRSIEQFLRDELPRSMTDQTSLTVMAIDLDGFKAVNDQFGHLEGDEVLRFVAAMLREQLRADDRIARWGGDEFLVVFPGLEVADVLPVAERLRTFLARQPKARGVTMSIGLADTTMQFPSGQVSATDLIAHADALLYRSKHGGRNRVATDPAIVTLETA